MLGYPQRVRPADRAAAAADGADPRGSCRATGGSGRGDLGRNGSYLVLRQLQPGRRRASGSFTRRATRAADGPPTRPRAAARGQDRRSLAERRAARAARRSSDDPALADANDFGYHARRPARPALPARRARPPRQPARLARPASRAPSDSLDVNKRHRLLRRGRAVRPPVLARRRSTGGPATPTRRARAALHLPQREHRAPVRVRPAHLDQQPEVRRPLRRRRPTAEQRRIHAARGAGARALRGRAAVRPVRGGAYFFLPTAVRAIAAG